jgi:hypothetical protein
MGLRVMFCPVVGTGNPGDPRATPPVPEDPYRAQIDGLVDYTAIIPSKPDGSPKFSWCVVVARSGNWSAVDAVGTFERVFGVDLPDTINTFAELRTFLQSKTVGDIPSARRQALNTRLQAKGLDTSKITLQTTWWQVLKGIYQQVLGFLPQGDGMAL